MTAHVHTTGSRPSRARRQASAHHFSHSPLTLSLAALSESRKTRAPPLTAATLCIARSACIASLVPVLCMMTDYGRCGVHIVQPLRSPVGCVCPQQSKRFKFARAWQPLTRSLTPHPPRTTPVWDPSTLARMQFEGEVIVLAGLLACLLASGRVFPMASRGSATWVGSNLWAFQW